MFTVRPARAADAPSLQGIERSADTAFLALPDLAWVAAGPVTTAERHLELIRGETAWVATNSAGEPVGFLGAEQVAGNLHIWQLAVSRDLQGRGLGRRLLEAATVVARSREMPMLTLTTFRAVPWNEPFYQRCGFRTLAADDLPDALRRILDREAEQGLPAPTRCAMVRLLG